MASDRPPPRQDLTTAWVRVAPVQVRKIGKRIRHNYAAYQDSQGEWCVPYAVKRKLHNWLRTAVHQAC
eukprot:6200114-Pleurochrysis_carterae.AAC.3